MLDRDRTSARSNFRKFFLRGLAIVLPSVLTIWLLVVAYQFLRDRIAEPINRGVRWALLAATPWPPPTIEVAVLADPLSAEQRRQWAANQSPQDRTAWEAAGHSVRWLQENNRAERLRSWWQKYALGLDLIGLVIAVGLVYMAGAILGSIIGRRLYHRGEELLHRVPLIRQVYPSVKQVTDFLVGTDKDNTRFSRVVAVEYPRKGIWSLGLVTGATMGAVEQATGRQCLTVFVPSSPTPFTGYVISVPQADTFDLPITIEQALRFVISGGVILPPELLAGRLPAAERLLAGAGRAPGRPESAGVQG